MTTISKGRTQLTAGDIVKYRKIIDPGDEFARYVLLETPPDNDFPVDMRFIGRQRGNRFQKTKLAIPPVVRAKASELQLVHAGRRASCAS